MPLKQESNYKHKKKQHTSISKVRFSRSFNLLVLLLFGTLLSTPSLVTAQSSQPTTSALKKKLEELPFQLKQSSQKALRLVPKKLDMPKMPPLRYKIELITVGTGRWLFTYFGHNALVVNDRVWRRSRTYNFGTFSMSSPVKMLRDYMQFVMVYWLSTPSKRSMLRHYKKSGRTLKISQLNLKPEETERLVRHLRKHARPSNRRYRYHHYTSNCSTKLRDALVLAIGPSFSEHARKSRSQWTYRTHVRNRMRPNPAIQLFMDFGTGPNGDKPLSRWEDMFLPSYLETYLRDGEWKKQRGTKLIGSAKVLVKRADSTWAWSPVTTTYVLLAFWLLLGLLFSKPNAFRHWLRNLLLLLFGAGMILVIMMFFTNMPEPPNNINILLYHPLHLIAWWLLSKKRWLNYLRVIRFYLLAHIGIGAVYLVIKALGVAPVQSNLHYYIFVIIAFVFAIYRCKQVEQKREELLEEFGSSKQATSS